MKIAISSSGLSHVLRGVENSAKNLAHELIRNGVDVTLFKGSGPDSSKQEKIIPCIKRDTTLNKLILNSLPSSSWRLGLGSQYQIEQTSFTFGLLAHFMRNRYDILFTKDPMVADVIRVFKKLKLINTKVIFCNGTEEPYSFMKKFDFVQHLAPHHLQEARERGINGKGQFAIPNFVDVNKFHPEKRSDMRKKLGIPSDAFVVLTVAAIKKHHKRIDYFLNEMGILKKLFGEKIHALVVGSQTDQTKELVQMGKDTLGKQVIFLVNQTRGRMPEIYKAADVFTLCSLKEMMPNALLEALASGIPAICHEYPVHEWIIGSGGECIDMTKEGALAKALEKYLDKGYRAAIGKKAREQAVNNFSKEKIVEQTIQMYKAVLQRK